MYVPARPRFNKDQKALRVDYAISDNDKIFGSYSIEKGVSGVPQNEYYSARGNLGGINVPGGGLLSQLSSHVGDLNYTHIFGPSLTNEFYAAAVYFAQAFTAKTASAIANNPYEGVFKTAARYSPRWRITATTACPFCVRRIPALAASSPRSRFASPVTT